MSANMARFPFVVSVTMEDPLNRLQRCLSSVMGTNPSLPTTSYRYICHAAAAAAAADDDDAPSQSTPSKEAHSVPRPVSYKATHRLRKPHFRSLSASPFPQQCFFKHLTDWTSTQTASCTSAPRASSLSSIHPIPPGSTRLIR